jgi:iron complex outermembrane receptor protein
MQDGMRVPGTSATGTVDINTLPQALVQRVEIVTGGASAIYGSDAVGGVVNYILNTNFNGFKGSAQTGISTYGDAPSNKFSLAFGSKVFGSGHFELSYERSHSAGLNGYDRDYTNSSTGYAGTGATASNPFVLYNNLRMATTTAGGYISAVAGATAGQTTTLSTALLSKQFIDSGTLAAFNAGTATGSLPTNNTGGLQVGGDGAYLSGMQLLKPVNTDNVFARFDYDLGRVTAYTQVGYGLSTTDFFAAPTAAYSTTFYSGNPYLPTTASSALASASAPGKPASFTLSSLPQNLIQMQQTNQRASDLSAVVGLKGKVFNDRFNWNAGYTYGVGTTRIETDNNINTSRFYAALDAVKDPSTGNTVCNVSLTSSASLYPGCVPLDFFGQGNESAASLAYIMQNTEYTIRNRLDDVAASISGSAFDNWAGPVSVAANAEYRSASLTETTNAPPAAPQLAGLRTTWVGGLRGATPSTLFLNNTVAPQYGSNSVWEVGGETLVPLLKNLPAAENLEFNGAARYTRYSSSGPATTWKAGINYQPIHDLRLRVTASRDIRAPNLIELYQAPTVTPVTITADPGANNLTYTVNQTAQGNLNVNPEVATSNTWGLVYSPSWLPRFTMSADYYSITINGVISQTIPLGGGVTSAINTCLTSGGTSAYCQAVPRDPVTHQITQVYNIPINLSETYIRGLDVEASYGFDMADIHAKLVGHTDLRLLVNYQPESVTITNVGAQGTNQAGASVARTRMTATLAYNLGPFKASWQTNYTGPHHAGSASITPTYFADNSMPKVITDDLSLSYRFKAYHSDLQAFLTINNIFNQAPLLGPQAPTNIPGAQSPLGTQAISPLGRFFTAGVRISF